MAQQPKQPISEQQAEHDGNRARPSPQTDPTNPMRQESVGVFVPNEQKTEEPGAEGADGSPS